MPWGEEYTGATLVDMYLAELAAHAWDLARATGQLGKLVTTGNDSLPSWYASHGQRPVDKGRAGRRAFRSTRRLSQYVAAELREDF